MSEEQPVEEYRPIRIIYQDTDLLKIMRQRRESLGMTMDDVNWRSGSPDRYYNKVEIGAQSEARRRMKRKLEGRGRPKSPTVRRPFRMLISFSWTLEAMGLVLVVMTKEQALEIVDSDPAVDIDRRLQARNVA